MPEKDSNSSASSASPDSESTPADVFGLVGHEIRAEIIEALMGEYHLSLSGLRGEMDTDVEPSQLHYHLDQLDGHFVDSDDDGYHIRPEGIRLYLTIHAGTLDRQREVAIDPDFDCHICGTTLESSFAKGVVRVECPECVELFGYDFLLVPMAAFEDDIGAFSLANFREYIGLKTLFLARGVCPNCANTLEPEFRYSEEHDYPRKVHTHQLCDLCKANWKTTLGRVLLADLEVLLFCYDHGKDVLSTPYWELEFAAMDEHLTVRDDDPWEISLRVTLDGETLELVVDGDLNVIERNRSSSGDNEATGDDLILPDNSACLDTLRRHRWPDGVTCPHCDSTETTKEGTTAKGAQRYRCHACNTIFNDLTGTVFAGRLFTLPEMFYIVGEIEETKPAQIARDLDRSYESVLDFVHVVRDNRDDDPGFDLSDVCETMISP